MANPTNPFNWQMPTASDLVTDLPADFETFGQAVATSMADLLGGTTDQVLAKNSNTDMDFKWVTSDDANAIQNSIVDAKGDLIAASANDTPARLAVGNNGETLVADSSASVGLSYQRNFAAGKNAVINGDFNIWQRGTTFTVTGTEGVAYKADRWAVQADGSTTTRTISRQAFTPGTAPVAGYEGNYFLRYAQTTAGNNSYNFLTTRIENVTTFAGQTVTLSFWAKADSTRTVSTFINQNFGSGGSSAVGNSSQNNSLTTAWQRFSHTVALSSISGKTIGTSSFIEVVFSLPTGAITPTIDFWGVQLEAGSVATAFQTATGTLQGELAACQRYYYRVGGTDGYEYFAFGMAYSTTAGVFLIPFKSTMRVTPSSVDYASIELVDPGTGSAAVTALTIDNGGRNQISLQATVASGLTNKRTYFIRAAGTSAGFIALNSEL
jgi:hypothetical protein